MVDVCLTTLKNLESWDSVKDFVIYDSHNTTGKSENMLVTQSAVHSGKVYLEIMELKNGWYSGKASTYLSPDQAIELGEALVEIGNTVKKANEPDALDVATKEIVDDMSKIVEALKGLSNIK